MSQASHFCRKLKRKNRVFSALCLPHLNNLFCPIHYLQSAYRPTQRTALFKVVNDILRALDNGNVPVLTLLDLSSMYHQILFSRLGTLNGISCTALSWFESYLSGRIQTVTINNRKKPISLLLCAAGLSPRPRFDHRVCMCVIQNVKLD